MELLSFHSKLEKLFVAKDFLEQNVHFDCFYSNLTEYTIFLNYLYVERNFFN